MLTGWNIYNFPFSLESQCPHGFLRLVSVCFEVLSCEEECVSRGKHRKEEVVTVFI